MPKEDENKLIEIVDSREGIEELLNRFSDALLDNEKNPRKDGDNDEDLEDATS